MRAAAVAAAAAAAAAAATCRGCSSPPPCVGERRASNQRPAEVTAEPLSVSVFDPHVENKAHVGTSQQDKSAAEQDENAAAAADDAALLVEEGGIGADRALCVDGRLDQGPDAQPAVCGAEELRGASRMPPPTRTDLGTAADVLGTEDRAVESDSSGDEYTECLSEVPR